MKSQTGRDVAIVAGVRTAFGRAGKGVLKDTRPDTMAAEVIREAVARAKMPLWHHVSWPQPRPTGGYVRWLP